MFSGLNCTLKAKPIMDNHNKLFSRYLKYIKENINAKTEKNKDVVSVSPVADQKMLYGNKTNNKALNIANLFSLKNRLVKKNRGKTVIAAKNIDVLKTTLLLGVKNLNINDNTNGQAIDLE